MSFSVTVEPSDTELAAVEARAPTNPFSCARYAAARRARGSTIVLFANANATEKPATTIGYMRGHAISRILEITSAPDVAPECNFWDGVLDFCRQHHVAEIEIDSYGSSQVSLPAWTTPSTLRERTEWVMQLTDVEALKLASNHRRNINKARKLGCTATHTTDQSATDTHVSLMNASMQRRSDRGESVPVLATDDTSDDRALLASGAARLYQASYLGNVVSSLMVLVSTGGAYYQSAGTSPEGMEIGASTFLISEAIRDLAQDGKKVFNLGGAGPESEGLRRFKAGFGAKPVALAAGVYQIASPMHRRLRTAIGLIRQPTSLRTSIARRLAALFVIFTAGNLS
jgi:GNAT acetyltransferase-like protein